MQCFKCLTENSEVRKYCRECGSLIVSFCKKCGFHNSAADKYCGGCGVMLEDMKTPEAKNESLPHTADVAGRKYSTADISELTDKSLQPPKKKNIEDRNELSQDAIDSIFNDDSSDEHKKGK